jgi:flagellar basal-body rod modification protein FlgD
MSIEGIAAGYGGTSVSSEKTSSDNNIEGLGMNQFLTLLVAQLEHQDPLNPLDSAEFTAQLAQFSSVEQQYAMNKNLEDIKEIIGSQGQQQDLIGFIGKTIKADDDTILIKDGSVLSGSYSVEGVGDVTINIFDDSGLMVRTLYFKEMETGEHKVDWDGRDDRGDLLKDGTYNFAVTAKDGDGRYIPTNTHITGEVTGVTYQYGYPYLMIGERLISDDAVVEVSRTANGIP